MGLAVLDLIVGVSNDAINFLNSAIGSKAIPFKTIMVISCTGVFLGSVTSAGMMEVARQGVFNPNMYMFNEIMYIFIAVMITDVLLLDAFNSLGMPTSTTVSVIFELLGAAVAVALIKIFNNDSQSIYSIGLYINNKGANQIIVGIVISVIIAFTIGAVVQYFSRVIFTFNFYKRPLYINVLFGGIAMTSIVYFIIIRGLQGTPFYEFLKAPVEKNTFQIVLGTFLFCSVLSYILLKLFRLNILVVIIGVGTFSLAMAFSGNDLVNFIGVPMAGLKAYREWSASGVLATDFSMGVLEGKVRLSIWWLLLAGLIMIITICISKRARAVVDTGVNLSRQGEGQERFKPNNLSRIVVRLSMFINRGLVALVPKKTLNYLNSKFEKPYENPLKSKGYEKPAFDLVRAAVNLIVASVLISVATSLKYPLSTTYVTFMVAMGSSLADRAWGRDSAVYRVAGVFNVIAGWFLTAITAFIIAGIIAFLISKSIIFIPLFLILVVFLLTKNSINYTKKMREIKKEEEAKKVNLITIGNIIEETSDRISEISEEVERLYTNVIEYLSGYNLKKLKKANKSATYLSKKTGKLKDDAFFFIKPLEESSLQASKFYILILKHLQDITQSVSFVSRLSYRYVNDNHKELKKSQLKDLKIINSELTSLLSEITKIFRYRTFDKLHLVIKEKGKLLSDVSKSFERQVEHIKREESSPKNTTLHFNILLETKDLIVSLLNLIETYNEFYFISKESKSVFDR